MIVTERTPQTAQEARGRPAVLRARWQPELVRRFDSEARRRGQTTSETLRELALAFLDRCATQQNP